MATTTRTRKPSRNRRSTSSRRAEPAELRDFVEFCAELTLDNRKPFVVEPFQRLILTDLFEGATETLVLLPKKNGKSTLVAALALYHLLVTQDAECYIAAASREQAGIILKQARKFINGSPALARLFQVNRREIHSLADEGVVKVLASDVDTADGLIPTLAIVDELHRHKNADLYGIFRDGLGPRGGQMVTISTAGDDDDSPLGKMRRAAHQLPNVDRKGAYRCCRSANGAYVMHEWALDPTDDRSDMKVVKRANPASWQTEDELLKRFASPTTTPWQWARFACGVWLRGEDAAIQPHDWDRLATDDRIPAGADVLVGLDLGWKEDTTALVPVFWDGERALVSDVVVLEPPADGMLDDREIEKALLDLADRFTVRGVVFDPNAGGQQFAQRVERDHNIEFIEHSQKNSTMAVASQRLSEAIRTGAFAHDGDEMLRSHALNAIERPLGGELWRYDRPRRGARRPIDGLTALLMAHSVTVAGDAGPSVYEDRGLLTI